jgi:glutamine amidotransferase
MGFRLEIMPNKYVAIVDYGSGNLGSIQNALRKIEQDSIITNEKSKIENASQLILPGVGAFPVAMSRLDNLNLIEPIIKFAESGKTLLGICLGMQLLMESSSEFMETKGLNLIAGKVVRLDNNQNFKIKRRIPNIGWYQVEKKRTRIESGLVESDEIVGLTQFGDSFFCSMLSKANILGIQFHPEKSGNSGLRILKKFTEL